MEINKEIFCRSRFALFSSSVYSRRKGKVGRCTEPSRLCYDKMVVLCKDCHVIVRITWSVKVLQ